MAEEKPIARVTVGVNVLVIRDGKVLLGKRKGVTGDGMWGLPGGRLDEGEWIYDAAQRELKEETGLRAKTFHLVNVVHQLQHKREHWIQLGFEADDWKGEVKLMEPNRCYEWEWFDIDRLPKPMFPSHLKHIEQWRKFTSFLEEEEICL